LLQTWLATYSGGHPATVSYSIELGAYTSYSLETYTWAGNDLVSWTEEEEGGEEIGQGTITYDNGLPVDLSIDEWDGSQWVQVTHKTATYDNEGHQIVYLNQQLQDSVWDEKRDTHTWEGDLVSEVFSEILNGSTWEPESTDYFIWQGEMIETITGWDWDGSTYVEHTKSTFTNSGSQTNERLDQLWDPTTRGWVNAQRYIYSYSTSVTHDKVPAIELEFSCYPNPFNPTTTISFSVKPQEIASIEIFNTKGQQVRDFGQFKTGKHEIVWDGTANTGKKTGSGVYFYRLKSDSVDQVRKMLLLK